MLDQREVFRNLAEMSRDSAADDPSKFGRIRLARADILATVMLIWARSAGAILDLREVFRNLADAWRDSERPGENMLLPVALPSVLKCFA